MPVQQETRQNNRKTIHCQYKAAWLIHPTLRPPTQTHISLSLQPPKDFRLIMWRMSKKRTLCTYNGSWAAKLMAIWASTRRESTSLIRGCLSKFVFLHLGVWAISILKHCNNIDPGIFYDRGLPRLFQLLLQSGPLRFGVHDEDNYGFDRKPDLQMSASLGHQFGYMLAHTTYTM